MALSVAPSTRVFNGNASRQGYNVSSSCKGSKCLCCPYGYHIDLDFVRYCEAVAAGSTSDRSTLERRKKRERRRQCQSMEVLLGLVSPALAGLEAQLPKVSQECATTNGVITTLPRSNYVRTGTSTQYSPGLDLSDVVGDFEDTLRRSSKSSFTSSRQHETDGTNVATPMQNVAQPESGDFDNASIGSGNSNLSTGALQNIREQMAVSLERMRDLEEQVKAIPMLQIQLSVLKEEKRNLLRQIDELTRTNAEQEALQRHRTRSFSENRRYNSANSIVSTRDMGTMCGAMTRDVGVSHRQIRTRDFGMVTSTPIKISDATEETKTQTSWESLKSSCSPSMWKPSKLMSLSRSELVLGNISPEMKRKILLKRSPLQLESIAPKELEKSCESVKKKLRDFGTNTYPQVPKPRLERSELLIEEILPEIPQKVEIKKRSCGVTTYLRMRDVIVPDQLASTVENALEDYINREKHHKGVQCQPEVIPRRDAHVQTAEQFKMRSNVGVTAKPRTSEIGVDVKMTTAYRTVAVGPDPVSTQPVSLNSMNSRSHSFNYGDTKPKRKTTKSVGVHVEDLIKTSSRGTDTSSLLPKKREFGTSPIKKKFADVSVGESVRTHISISCTANYCDNCKETIKNLAKQISMNENNHHQNTVTNVSRIPRPAHINLSTDNRKPFKRQDTYTKIPTSGVIKYDADNKEQYENSNRLEELKTEQVKDEKSVSEESTQLIIKNEEKQQQQQHHHHPTILPETALFQPIQDKPRKKVEPSKEMRAAMKVLNDNLKKSPSKNISHQIKNATNVIQQEWFKMSSTADANPLDIEDYLDCFEECSGSLLEYVVNMTDSSGNTAMHYAVSHGNFDVVSILLDSKVCDINKANVAGYTAVMLAALVDVRNSTHASVANRLFQLADVNIRAKLHGQTALMLAVSHGRKDMTELLLNAGAAINIQDEDGSTALMCAAEHGHTDIVRLLLSHPDCDSSIVDIDGSSALKIALEAGNRDIGVLLYAHERVNRGTSPYSSMRKSRRGSKPTTPTGPSPSAPVSPAPSRKLHSSNLSLNSSKYSSKQ